MCWTHTHTHAHAYMHARTDTRARTHTHTHTHTHTYACTHARTHAHAPARIQARAKMQARTHARTDTRARGKQNANSAMTVPNSSRIHMLNRNRNETQHSLRPSDMIIVDVLTCFTLWLWLAHAGILVFDSLCKKQSKTNNDNNKTTNKNTMYGSRRVVDTNLSVTSLYVAADVRLIARSP